MGDGIPKGRAAGRARGRVSQGSIGMTSTNVFLGCNYFKTCELNEDE